MTKPLREYLHHARDVLAGVAVVMLVNFLSCGVNNPASELPPAGMRFLSGGTFIMGEDGIGEAMPVHSVTLSSFYIDTTEVTQADYESLMDTNPSYFRGGLRPVDQVTWYDALRYCNARSRRDGYDGVYDTLTWEADFAVNGYRLPTSSEWEYACRAGTTTTYFWEPDTIDKYAWYWINSGNETHDVAGKLPNAWGLYDISGNVWEWCNDIYGRYTEDSKIDPIGPDSGDYKVIRGGSCGYNGVGFLRIALPYYAVPESGYPIGGFRCVLRRCEAP